MEAQLVRELPEGDGWQYEPKWDGFRGVLENAGGELALWSRKERPLLRYFPELRPLGDLLPPDSALDGEIVIARDGALDFDAMQTRLHPGRVADPEAFGGDPGRVRRLRRAASGKASRCGSCRSRSGVSAVEALSGFRISPATRDIGDARAWMAQFEALGLDGVIGKRLSSPYLPGCARRRRQDQGAPNGGLRGDRRPLEGRPLGDRDVAARSVPRRRRLRLRRLVRGRREDARRRRGARAAARRRVARPALLGAESVGDGELEQTSLREGLVAEVRYDKVQGNRFRHGTKFIRWREDKDPRDCTWREVTPAARPERARHRAAARRLALDVEQRLDSLLEAMRDQNRKSDRRDRHFAFDRRDRLARRPDGGRQLLLRQTGPRASPAKPRGRSPASHRSKLPTTRAPHKAPERTRPGCEAHFTVAATSRVSPSRVGM